MLCTEIMLLSVDRRRSQPSAEKVTVRVAGRKRWRLEIPNTYTAVPGTRIPGTRYIGTRDFLALVPGERTSRNSPQTFEKSSEKLSGDGELCP